MCFSAYAGTPLLKNTESEWSEVVTRKEKHFGHLFIGTEVCVCVFQWADECVYSVYADKRFSCTHSLLGEAHPARAQFSNYTYLPNESFHAIPDESEDVWRQREQDLTFRRQDSSLLCGSVTSSWPATMKPRRVQHTHIRITLPLRFPEN